MRAILMRSLRAEVDDIAQHEPQYCEGVIVTYWGVRTCSLVPGECAGKRNRVSTYNHSTVESYLVASRGEVTDAVDVRPVEVGAAIIEVSTVQSLVILRDVLGLKVGVGKRLGDHGAERPGL